MYWVNSSKLCGLPKPQLIKYGYHPFDHKWFEQKWFEHIEKVMEELMWSDLLITNNYRWIPF